MIQFIKNTGQFDSPVAYVADVSAFDSYRGSGIVELIVEGSVIVNFAYVDSLGDSPEYDPENDIPWGVYNRESPHEYDDLRKGKLHAVASSRQLVVPDGSAAAKFLDAK